MRVPVWSEGYLHFGCKLSLAMPTVVATWFSCWNNKPEFPNNRNPWLSLGRSWCLGRENHISLFRQLKELKYVKVKKKKIHEKNKNNKKSRSIKLICLSWELCWEPLSNNENPVMHLDYFFFFKVLLSLTQFPGLMFWRWKTAFPCPWQLYCALRFFVDAVVRLP